MKDQKVIAILGLPGAGKTVVIEYLMGKYGWPKVYFGDVTFDEMKNRGLEINEKNERTVREDLRAKFGRLYYASQVIKKIENLADQKYVLVESLYDWAEYLHFKEQFGAQFKTIAIYVPPALRYERLVNRTIRPLSPEQAQGRDYAQIENIFQAGPISMADFTVKNEGTFDDLYSQIDQIIEKLK